MTFPDTLIEAFKKVRKDWDNEQLYAEFVIERDNFLKKDKEDVLEQCKLIVQLMGSLNEKKE